MLVVKPVLVTVAIVDHALCKLIGLANDPEVKLVRNLFHQIPQGLIVDYVSSLSGNDYQIIAERFVCLLSWMYMLQAVLEEPCVVLYVDQIAIMSISLNPHLTVFTILQVHIILNLPRLYLSFEIIVE